MVEQDSVAEALFENYISLLQLLSEQAGGDS